MKILNIGDVVKINSFRTQGCILREAFKIGDLFNVVEIGVHNKARESNVLCNVNTIDFCERSSTEQCVKVKHINSGREAWICDIEVEKVNSEKTESLKEDIVLRKNIYREEYDKGEEVLIREIMSYSYENDYIVLLFSFGSMDISVVSRDLNYSKIPFDYSHSLVHDPKFYKDKEEYIEAIMADIEKEMIV